MAQLGDILDKAFAGKDEVRKLTEFITRGANHNDHRAAHKVNITPSGFNVKIPYRGYVISLHAEGEDIHIEHPNENTLYGLIFGTSGESIREAMDFIDKMKEN